MARMYHVTSSLNRSSIERHGLDFAQMGSATGIAGSDAPEVEGCFLCVDPWDVRWFAEVINNTGGSVDVWEVDTDGLELVEHDGYPYYPGKIPASRIRLIETDRQAQP
jgi:hypothetical protein